MLDYLPVADLVHCAHVSRRLKEMVYDDTRWVRKLQAIGCWNEGAARARAESARRNRANNPHDAEDTSQDEPTKHMGTSPPSRNPSNNHQADHSRFVDGFDSITLSPASNGLPSQFRPLDNDSVLQVINNARSVRGTAKGEYGRIHAALRPFYRDAVRSKHPSNAKIFRVYRDPNQQAQMLSQLIRFSRSDLTQGSTQREKRLNSMVAAFEDAVMKEYEQGLRIGDVDGRMRKYALVLITLNGGQRAVDRFVSENPLLKDGQELGNPLDCFSPSNPEVLFLEESHSFFGHLSAAYSSQVVIIERVFPPSANVTLPLLHKVWEEIVSPYLSKLFTHARNLHMESYIRAISGTYEQVLQFTDSLALLPLFDQGQKDSLQALVLDTFLPHVASYFHEELELFRRRSDAEVTGWERQLSQQDASIESLYMSNVNRQADKRDFLSSFRKVVMAPVNALPVFPFSTKASSAKAAGESLEASSTRASSRSSTPVYGDATRHMDARAPSYSREPPSTELAAKAAIMKSRLEGIKSLFSLEVALNLVHMAKSSIDRAAVFARVSNDFQVEARAQCEAIFTLLLKTLGDRHVRAGFDQAVEHLSKYNPRAANDRDDQPGVTPLVVFLELVNVGDLIQQMLDVFYEQELVAARLTDRNDFLNPTTKEKKRFEQMLDERVAAGLNKGIEVLMAEVEYICATTQNVEDFNPGATGVAIQELIDVSPTNTAIWVVEMVSAHTRMLVGSTDKNMLDVFNQEVGLRLFNALCKHLKRQRISVAGSIRLIR